VSDTTFVPSTGTLAVFLKFAQVERTHSPFSSTPFACLVTPVASPRLLHRKFQKCGCFPVYHERQYQAATFFVSAPNRKIPRLHPSMIPDIVTSLRFLFRRNIHGYGAIFYVGGPVTLKSFALLLILRRRHSHTQTVPHYYKFYVGDPVTLRVFPITNTFT
jgi:hypothetical protein